MPPRPVLVIGMTRSGTTLAASILAACPALHVEVEPQMLWKSGSFAHLGDDRFERDERAARWIRDQLLGRAGDRALVDKSPSNCLRPGWAHEVFPYATILYIERDPVRCARSNLHKSRAREALKARIVLRKYLVPPRAPGPSAGALGERLDAVASRSVFAQVRTRDVPAFGAYTARMLWLRDVRRVLPFGPKLTGFAELVAREGLAAYHCRAVVAAERSRDEFERLFRQVHRFRLEDLQTRADEVERLLVAAGVARPGPIVDGARAAMNDDLVRASRASQRGDAELRGLLDRFRSQS